MPGSAATSSRSSRFWDGHDEAAALAAKLEGAMARQESRITFGWAVYPADGENALSLYRAADERLYARKLVRGQRAGRSLYTVGAL